MVETGTAPALPTTPAVAHRKRTVIIALAISAIILVVIVLSALAVWQLRNSAEAPATPVGNLPEAGEQAGLPAETVPVAPSSPPPVPGQIPLSLRVPAFQNNLGVAIMYKREPNFTLALSDIRRTIENPTPDRNRPAEGAPHSLVRVKNAAGDVIHEQPFAVATQVELVFEDTSLVTQPTYALPESTIYLVIPVNVQNPPAAVEIAATSGATFASRTFNFLELPVKPATKAIIGLVGHQPAHARAANALTRLFSLGRPPAARAQQLPAPGPPGEPIHPTPTPPPSPSVPPAPSSPPAPTPSPDPGTYCTGSCFTIAVIGADATSLRAAYQQTLTMVKQLEPWATYGAQIRVVPVQVGDEKDLNCFTIEGAGGRTMPLCPDGAASAAAVNGLTWNTAVVVTNVDCNCGTVQDVDSSNVAAIGSRASSTIIGHELGHSVGRMVDEYYYQYKFESGPLGPNCFESQQSCQDSTKDLTGVTCTLGCRTVNSWRPSSQLMHTVLSGAYGPLETCIMAKQISSIVGGTTTFGECVAPGSNVAPAPPPAQPGIYYGGRR